jgi:hypothetical protein
MCEHFDLYFPPSRTFPSSFSEVSFQTFVPHQHFFSLFPINRLSCTILLFSIKWKNITFFARLIFCFSNSFPMAHKKAQSRRVGRALPTCLVLIPPSGDGRKSTLNSIYTNSLSKNIWNIMFHGFLWSGEKFVLGDCSFPERGESFGSGELEKLLQTQNKRKLWHSWFWMFVLLGCWKVELKEVTGDWKNF